MAKKRIEANDPVALLQMGIDRYEERDYGSTFEYYTKAAEVGNMLAHQKLGHMYREGEGVEKDMKKAIYHWEVAAIGGHPSARAVLGVIERSRGRHERAMKHFIIAVNQGLDGAVEQLKNQRSCSLAKQIGINTSITDYFAVACLDNKFSCLKRQ